MSRSRTIQVILDIHPMNMNVCLFVMLEVFSIPGMAVQKIKQFYPLSVAYGLGLFCYFILSYLNTTIEYRYMKDTKNQVNIIPSPYDTCHTQKIEKGKSLL